MDDLVLVVLGGIDVDVDDLRQELVQALKGQKRVRRSKSVI